jgi:hypothetical protein
LEPDFSFEVFYLLKGTGSLDSLYLFEVIDGFKAKKEIQKLPYLNFFSKILIRARDKYWVH